MVLRETQFLIGGVLVAVAGGLFLGALWWSGAGWLYFEAWIGGALAIAFGLCFVQVARAERRERRAFLTRSETEAGRPPPSG
ncbi:MAG TPA: hypothetical protein VMG81_05010 [Thermoplasmata archaeon]|nr:hypothetical protein [Thermoplasmata archaeon]